MQHYKIAAKRPSTCSTLDLLEKEPTAPHAVLDMIPQLRADTLALLKQDAEERGIPDDDH